MVSWKENVEIDLKDNVRMVHEGMMLEAVGRINLANYKVQCWVPVNMLINF
jgi:hypothetical protein